MDSKSPLCTQHWHLGGTLNIYCKVLMALKQPPLCTRGQPQVRAEKCDVPPQWHHPQLDPEFSRTRRWRKGKENGSGSFGTVYEAITENGLLFAVKEVDLNDKSDRGETAIKHLQQEIEILTKLQHPNIVSYWGSERDGAKLYIFLELCRYSLRKIYEDFKLGREQVRSYTKQIVVGLKYLHDQDIIHRDIKCENILSERDLLKLADFGLAKLVDKLKGTGTPCVGTFHWMAPEVMNCNSINNMYNYKADIWSLGCSVLEMAANRLPYGNEAEYVAVIFKLGRGALPPIPDDLDEDLKDFISTCLKVNPQERPTCDVLLAHPFIARS